MKARAVIGIGVAVAVLHAIVELATWARWDAAPAPGQPYPHPMPALWPIVSFPVFLIYGVLSGGDRAMFGTFWWVMLGNSVVWGTAAGAAVLRITTRRHATHES